MDQNPFSPPHTEIAHDPRLSEDSPPKSLVMLVLALFAIHAVIMWRNFGFYFESVRTGAVHPIGPLFGLFADIILVLGIVVLLFKRRAGFAFLAACAGFLVAVYFLLNAPFHYSFVLVTYGLGAVTAFVGWWVASHHRK